MIVAFDNFQYRWAMCSGLIERTSTSNAHNAKLIFSCALMCSGRLIELTFNAHIAKTDSLVCIDVFRTIDWAYNAVSCALMCSELLIELTFNANIAKTDSFMCVDALLKLIVSCALVFSWLLIELTFNAHNAKTDSFVCIDVFMSIELAYFQCLQC